MSEAASESTPADSTATPSIENRIVALRQQVQDLDGPAAGTDLVRVSGVDPDSAVELKTSAAEQRAAANAMRREVAEMEQAIREQYELQLAEARQLMAPLLEKINQANEVIATLNLYLGRDEEIILIADGNPAPATTPLTVRQMVLSMDEETALYSDDGGDEGGMDFTNLEDFDAWLTADPAHLQQILPEERGVIALVPRRRGRDYNDPWMNQAGAEENSRTYWLIRNGEKLWRMVTELNVGKNLVPARDEFTGLFRESRYNHETRQNEWHDLVPGSRDWLRAEKAQGAKQRHFFRIALILQGLIDRTKIFYPLPDGGISLLHPESYESGKAVMLADGERTLESSRKPFYEWLRDLNSQLRPGMRFIAAFTHDHFRYDTVDNYRHGTVHRRITPRGASKPNSLVIHQIDRVEGGRLIFKYDRTDMVWTPEGDYRAPKTRASAWVKPEEPFILPIDLVDAATMREYLTARTERHAYLDSFALLKRGIVIKDEEDALEAPFREYLAASVAAELQLDLDTVRAEIGEVIAWWKLGNKWHRPLVKGEDPAAEAKAARMITAEYKARFASKEGADGTADDKAVQVLRTLDPSIMFIGRRHSGGYLAFAPQSRKYGESQGLREDVWVTEYTLSGAKGKPSKREWVLAGSRWQKTAPLFEADAWAGWDKVSTNYREHLTDGDIDELLAGFIPSVDRMVRVDGYRRSRNSDSVVDPDAELFGVTLVESNRLEAFVFSPALAAQESAVVGHREPKYVQVVASFEKDAKGVARFVYTPQEWSTHPNASWRGRVDPADATARPWSHIWHGRRSGREALVEDAAVYAKYLEFAATVKAHEDERSRKWDIMNRFLMNAENDSLQMALDAAKARYMEDYNDEEGWPDHRKTIKVKAVGFRSGYHSHGPKHPLETAIRFLVQSGEAIEGLTIRQVLELAKAGPEAIEQVETEGVADLIMTEKKDA